MDALPPARRGAHDYAINTGDLRYKDRHEGAGQHGETSGRYIGTDARHGYLPLTQVHPGKGFNLEVDQGLALLLGKGPHLGLSESDRLAQLVRQGFRCRVDLRLANSEVRGRPAVEF